MVNDILSDFITRIRNGYKSNLMFVSVIYAKKIIPVLDLFVELGYIRGYSIKEDKVIVLLKYNTKGSSSIYNISIISKTGRKLYSTVSTLWRLHAFNKGSFILTTSKGVLDSNTALKLNIGGEVLCYIV